MPEGDTALAVVEVIEGEVMNAPLTDLEREEHTRRVRNILENLHYIGVKNLEIWRDLKWINDNRTYREKYETFQFFCQGELGRDNSTVYRLMADGEIKEELLLNAADDSERLSILSLKESNTRFLRKLPEEVQASFWKLSFGIGNQILPKRDDGSIEITTQFLESVGERMDEALDQGGIHVDGEFISFSNLDKAAEVAGTDADTVKEALLALGVTEEYIELLKRQQQHIKEKSMSKADVLTLKGTIETRQDSNGSYYPILSDAKGNEYDLAEVLLSFNNRFLILSCKSPIRE